MTQSLLATDITPIFKTYIRQHQKPVWSNRDHLIELRHKKGAYGKEKMGYTTKNRNTVWGCKDEISNAKVWLVLKHSRHVKYNKKCFCRYIGSKKKTREITDLVVNQVGDLLMKGMKDAEVPNASLLSVFTSRISC